MRYYNFVFPMLLAAVAAMFLKQDQASVARRTIIALPVGAALLYAALSRLSPFTPNFTDCPELRGFTNNTTVLAFLATLSFVSLVLWIAFARVGSRFVLYVFAPLAFVLSTINVSQELRQRVTPDEYDTAGMFARHYLPPEELAKLVVVGTDEAGLFRTLFYLDSPLASLEVIPPEASFDISALPPRKQWALIIGKHPLRTEPFSRISLNGFTLAGVAPTTLDFRRALPPEVVVRGLSIPERWGAWSLGGEVAIEFPGKLPPRFRLDMAALAYGPNVGADILVAASGDVHRLTLAATPARHILEFDNRSRTSILTFVVPHPVSPASLGLGNDERHIGVGFIELEVVPLQD
jgi:phosphoglycerol transferase